MMSSHSESIAAVVGFLLMTLAPGLARAQSDAQTKVAIAPAAARVRPASAEAGALLAEGISRSPALARLVADLEQSDLIVAIEVSSFLPTAGDLTLIGATPAFRYARIRLRIPNARVDTIASLGHELQHAIELVTARDVRDSSAMRDLYARIGHDGWTHDRFETRAAQEMGWRVRDELMKSPPPAASALR
jgi:hypothetical protein